MKKFVSVIIVMFLLSGFSNSFAQSNIKLGHVDFAALYGLMPGLDSVRIEFEKYNKTYTRTICRHAD